MLRADRACIASRAGCSTAVIENTAFLVVFQPLLLPLNGVWYGDRQIVGGVADELVRDRLGQAAFVVDPAHIATMPIGNRP